MKKYFKEKWLNSPKLRKVGGIILIIIGLISILTPFTPIGFLFFVGLEILGIGSIFRDKIKSWFKNKF